MHYVHMRCMIPLKQIYNICKENNLAIIINISPMYGVNGTNLIIYVPI